MATLISAPANNSILNDANTTEIIIQDNNNNYSNYEARLFVNNSYFDGLIFTKIHTNSWFINDKKMILSFENLLQKYLQIPAVTNQFIQPFPMLVDLRIDVQKLDLEGYPSSDFTLNYKLKYSNQPTLEKYETEFLSFIAVDADVLLVQPNTMLQLPFFINDPSLIINVSAVTEDNVVLATKSTTGPQTSKTLLATLNVDAPDDVNAYYFKISAYNFEIVKKIKVVRGNYYKPKKIRFANRFGMPMLVELFGKITAKNEHAFFNYQNNKYQYKTAEVSTDTSVTIDTGYLLESEKAIVDQIATSLNVEIEINEIFTPCVVNTKTIPVIAENEIHSSAQLMFEFNKNPKHKN